MQKPAAPTKFRTFLSYYKPYRGLLAADLLSSLLSAALALALPICVRFITKDLLESGAADVVPRILRTGALMLAIVAAQTVFSVFRDYKGHDMGAKIERDMRAELFTHYQILPFRFYDAQKTGQLMSRLTGDLLNLAELCHHGPENLIVYGTQFVGSLIILLSINWRLALVVCAFLPVMAAYSFYFYRKLQTSYAANRSLLGDINAQAEENLSGIRTVQSFANEELELQKFTRANDRFYTGRTGVYKHEALHYSVVDSFFVPLITAGIAVAGGIWVSGGSLDLANLLVFVLYAAYLTGPVPKLAFMVQQYQDGLSGYRRFREIVDTAPEIRDAENASELNVTQGRVEFDRVTFRYGEDQDYVLRDICLDVTAGETVALVGRSGIGKTTLSSLLPRFYEVCSGDIRVDGVSIRDVTLRSLRRQIGVVRQETFLFSGTVMENILYGRPGATEAEAVEAAKKANAHEFILTLPNGYNTDIGQRGVKLSGGQQQRLSIARVFLKDPPILILDEATSALDYESERAVIESLKTLSKGRTTLIVAHRLSTIRGADRVIVLDGGDIAEQGSHEQLIAAGGLYAQLYASQKMGIL